MTEEFIIIILEAHILTCAGLKVSEEFYFVTQPQNLLN